MGKFYLENRHLWEKHRRERAYKQTLELSGGIGGGVPVDEAVEIRFEYQGEGRPPACLRVIDFGQERVAVEAGNAYIGFLDETGTQFMREYFRSYPQLSNVMPATLVGQEKWSGLWIARLGVGNEE